MGRQEQVEAFGGFSEVGCGKVREALCIVIPLLRRRDGSQASSGQRRMV